MKYNRLRSNNDSIFECYIMKQETPAPRKTLALIRTHGKMKQWMLTMGILLGFLAPGFSQVFVIPDFTYTVTHKKQWSWDTIQNFYLDTITGYLNADSVDKSEAMKEVGLILPVETAWLNAERYAMTTVSFNSKTDSCFIYKYKENFYVNGRSFYKNSNHLVRLISFNESYGLYKDISKSLMQARGYIGEYGVVIQPLNTGYETVVVEGPEEKIKKNADLKLYLWYGKSGRSYPLSKSFMKYLLRGHPELLKAWSKNPTEEKTIEILKRRHAIEPIIG